MEVNINLSTEQSAIVKDLIHDIKLPTPTIHVVVRNAGTGKTTLLNVLQNKIPKYASSRAAKVLISCLSII